MNNDNILLLKGQIRDDLKSIFFQESSGMYDVVFNNGKRFKYKKDNVLTLIKGEDVLTPVKVTRRYDGLVFDNIIGISTFVLEGSSKALAYRVIFKNGTHKDYLPTDLIIENHVRGERPRNVFNYLKDISEISTIPIDDDQTISLAQKYSRVKFITENSPLADYLSPDIICDRLNYNGIPIFPFGCNSSQYQAVTNALMNKISVVQGPPGTGKTQTILNIVANLLLKGESVEIISNNNSAVLNVAEKLAKDKYGLSWMSAYLGSNANKEKFYAEQKPTYPDVSSWERNDKAYCRSRIEVLSKFLKEGYAALRQLAELEEKKQRIDTQLQYYINATEDSDYSSIKIKSSATALDIYNRLSQSLSKRKRLGLFTRLRLKRHGIKDYKSGCPSLIRLYYELSRFEIGQEIAKLRLKTNDINSKEKELEEISLSYLHAVIYDRIKDKEERKIFDRKDVELHSPLAFLTEYPIVLSTTFSATTNVNAAYPFDYIIMDEASQVDVSAGALALNAARNAVIVGDIKQLPNVVTNDNRIAAELLFKKYDISDCYDYCRNSFLSSVLQVFPSIKNVLLKEHYRCAPKIIGFCNNQFYGGELIPMTTEGSSPSLKIWFSAEGNLARGTTNRRQTEIIIDEVIPSLLPDYTDIGIIAPYNDQVSLIRNALQKKGIDDIPVATVHKFQGRENDVIILSSVNNQVSEFTDDPHLLNVAISRAKKLFILVVSGNEQPSSNLRDLIEYIKYNNGEVNRSSICSIFDLLYSNLTDKRLEFLSKHTKVSKYESENLLYGIIEDVLKEQEFKKYGVISHYPLRLLIPPGFSLNEKEQTFAMKSWTHLDFIIYDKVTLLPILAVEVDGTAFHFDGSDQSKRDALKDKVLSKLGLTLLRVSTDGSREKEKIISCIRKVSH